MDTVSHRAGVASSEGANRVRVNSGSVGWLLLFAAATYLGGRPELTPTVAGTELRLLWFPFAFLNMAFLLRPRAEAPLYALIYAGVSLAAERDYSHLGFATARIILEIAQALVLVYVCDRRLRPLLNYPMGVALFLLAIIAMLALGALATIAAATLLSGSPSAYMQEMAGDPALAWRHWWLGNSCAYLTIAGPLTYIVLTRRAVLREFADKPVEARTFVAMASSLLLVSLVVLTPYHLAWVHMPPDIHLALMLIPAPLAFALAARFRGFGAAVSVLIITPLAIIWGTSSYPHHIAGLPSLATPMHVFLIITAAGCYVIAAIAHRYQKAIDDAMAASQAKARFVAMLNHELRTPLNAILGFSELMRLKNIRDMDEAIGPIENIHASGQRLLAMIEGLLSQADRGAGVFEIHRQQLNLRQIFDETATEMRSQVGGSGCTFEMRAPEDISIDADPKALKQIMIVLLSYPLRFCGPQARVCISARRVGTDTVVEIASTGLINAVADDRDKIEVQLVNAIALAHGARLAIAQQSRESRLVRLTFFATHAR